MRHILSIAKILLFVCLPFVGFGQIDIQTNFDPAIGAPIDVRFSIPTLADTSTISFTYPGLITWVVDIEQEWQYTDSWNQKVSGGTDDRVPDILSSLGVPAYADNMGVYPGTIVPDAGSVKDNVTALEAALQSVTDSIPALRADIGRGNSIELGFQVYGDTMFQFSRLVEVSTDVNLRNEFGGAALNPSTGRIVVVNKYSSSHSFISSEIAVSRYSDDGGATWSDTTHVFPNNGDGIGYGGGASVMWDFARNRFIASALKRSSAAGDDPERAYAYKTSTDGVNWITLGELAQADISPEGGTAYNFQTPVAPLVLQDSSILQTVYLTVDTLSGETAHYRVYVFRSTDGALTWDAGVQIHQGDEVGFARANECQIKQKKDGTLYAFIRGRDDRLVNTNLTVIGYQSADNGATWTGFRDASPPDYSSTKPSFEYFGPNDEYLFTMYRDGGIGAGVIGAWAYSETGDQGDYSTKGTLPNTPGYFLPGDIHKVNDYLGLIQYSATDTAGVLQPAPTRTYFQVLTFTPPTGAGGSGDITGTGTIGTVPLFDAAKNITDSRITQTVERVNIAIPETDSGGGLYVENTQGGFKFFNFTSAASSFRPKMVVTAKGRRPFDIQVTDNTDGGADAMMAWDFDISGGPVTNRPVITMKNDGTPFFSVNYDGRIGAGITSSQPDARLEILDAGDVYKSIQLSRVEDTTFAWLDVTSVGNLEVNSTSNLLLADMGVNIGGSVAATPIGVLNTEIGFRVNDAATSGNYLRGNGTNFVSSAIQASDVAGLFGSGTTGRLAQWSGGTLTDAPINNTGTQINQTQTTGFGLASGTTAQRDPSAPNGTIRHNADLAIAEVKLSGTWFPINADELNQGTVSTTPDGSGDITVTHALSAAPANVQLTAKGTTPYFLSWHSEDATTFKIRVLDSAGVAVTAGTVVVSWSAKTI